MDNFGPLVTLGALVVAFLVALRLLFRRPPNIERPGVPGLEPPRQEPPRKVKKAVEQLQEEHEEELAAAGEVRAKEAKPERGEPIEDIAAKLKEATRGK